MNIKHSAICILSILVTALSTSCNKNTIPPDYTVNVAVTDTTVFTQYGTPFASVPSPEKAVIYEVNTRAFSAGGNFQGVIARLDSIKALGVNVIYIMPIYPVGVLKTINSPYCVKDFLSVDAEYGTLTDFRALVDGAHSRNMSVILDWVANQTSWDNAWITEHPDWYERDASGNIINAPGYTDVAQLYYSNAAMRLQMIADMKYWIYTANLDGFRCDFADNIPDDFWSQAIDSMRNISTHKLLMLAEGTRSGNYTAGFDYNFGFSFYSNLQQIYSANGAVSSIDALNQSDYVGASGNQQIVRYLTNHDVDGTDGTPVQLLGGQNGSLAAFVVVALMKGVPFIYNGQEVGMATPITFPYTTVKIDWSINADVTAAYKNIIAIRNNNAAITDGQLTSYDNADICAFTKEQTGDSVLVIDNLRNSTINYTLPVALSNTNWKDAFDGSSFTATGTISLSPFEYKILINQ